MKFSNTLFLILLLSSFQGSSQSYLDSVSQSVKLLPDSTKAKRYIKAFRILFRNDLTQAKRATDSTYKYAVQSRVGDYIGRSIENLGSYYYLQNQLDSALVYYSKAYEQYQSINAPKRMAGAIGNQANVYSDKGDFLKAQKLYLKSIAIHDSLGIEGRFKANNLLNLGILYDDLDNPKEALAYYRKARKVFEGLKDELAVSEVEYNMAVSLLTIDSIQASKSILDRLEVYHRKHNHLYALNNVLMKNAQITYNNGDFKKSESILLECLDWAEKSADKSINLILYSRLMVLYSKQRKFDKAEVYALKSFDYTKQSGNKASLVIDYANLSQLYKDKNNYKKAYEYHVQYHDLNDSLFNIEKVNEIENLKQKYESDKKDSEIILLNQEVKINKLYKTIFAIGFVGSLISILFGIYLHRQRTKTEKIKRDAKEKELESALAYKRKELTSQTLHLVQKNTFLQNITNRLDEIKDVTVNYNKEIQKILTSLKIEPELDKDWDNFKAYFKEVHNDFDKILRARNSSISENEIRLAYLIRMQLNGSEIAAVMRVLPESVRKSKYRLKKKLDIGGQDLTEFLISL